MDKNKTSLNRYFDPLIDKNEAEGKRGLLLEYNSSKGFYNYRGERVVFVADLLPIFLIKALIFRDKGMSRLSHFDSFMKDLDLQECNALNIKDQVFRQTVRIQAWKRIFKLFFELTGAGSGYGLCYYANPVYGMNLACTELGIPSFDMQHGTQGPLHPAYNFLKAPEGGYNILPKHFCCWDEFSYKHILSWSEEFSCHLPILSGNPWNDYARDNYKRFTSVDLSDSKRLIVVTLQPVKGCLCEDHYELISSTKSHYTWWIRFHPRMSESERKEVTDRFEKFGSTKEIVFDDSNSIPIPILFQWTKLHLSRYSGSIIEAASAGVHTLILDEIGVNSFGYLLEDQRAEDVSKANKSELLSIIKARIN
ncbi:MAG: hypothetical protein AAF149_00505 [Bacteroidota bacterium]